MDFKVGDIIKGLPNNGHCITNENMTKAEVLEVNVGVWDKIKIKILEHITKPNEVGNTYSVENDKNRFELVSSSKINPFGKYTTLPERYTGNKDATILFWKDGSKTVVKKNAEDTYDIAKGFLWAYFLKTSGMSRTQANKYIEKVVNDIIAINEKEGIKNGSKKSKKINKKNHS